MRFAPLLSACLRWVQARPIRRSRHPRRSKGFPSLARLGLATAPALVVWFEECTGLLVRCSDRCPSPPGFPRVPLQRRSRVRNDAGMSWHLGRQTDRPGRLRPRTQRPCHVPGAQSEYPRLGGLSISQTQKWGTVSESVCVNRTSRCSCR